MIRLAGKQIDTSGYVVVRKVDLAELGKAIEEGDRLVGYGNPGNETECEYFFIGFKDAAQKKDIGNMTLEKWYFQDRN